MKNTMEIHRVLLLITIICYWSNACSDDNYEPNNTYDTASSIDALLEDSYQSAVYDLSFNASVCREDPVDLYRISLNASSYVVISAVYQESLGDLDVFLQSNITYTCS